MFYKAPGFRVEGFLGLVGGGMGLSSRAEVREKVRGEYRV
jgi:hypothetical protein